MSSDISFRWWLQASENLQLQHATVKCDLYRAQWVLQLKHGGGGPESFPWDYKLAESHWHSESYTIIIKQLCHPLLCPSPPLLLSVTVLIFYFFFCYMKTVRGSNFTGKDTEATKDRRWQHQTTTKGQIYRKWKDARPPLHLQLLFSWFKRTQWTPTPNRSRSDTAPVDKHTKG